VTTATGAGRDKGDTGRAHHISKAAASAKGGVVA
jgi:hypothetical protein